VVRVLLSNPPWVEGAVRAGSRWPAKYPKDLVVNYIPFPFYLAYTAGLLKHFEKPEKILTEQIQVTKKICCKIHT
jgi:hypothetical protein